MEKAKFGYKEINQKDKPDRVNKVFTSVSNKYDLMNDIMSFGLHRLWKRQFIRLCSLKDKKNVLDIACGTGDISLKIKKHNPNIKLTCLDPNNEMLQICKEKLLNRGFMDVNYENTSIELFKPSSKKFDLITVAFGFRNFSNHKDALMNIFSCLETCGVFIIMDFKKPRNKIQSQLFDFYTLNIIPRVGKAVTGDQESYRYLAESIQTYFSPEEIKEMCRNIGFEEIRIINLLEDVASIHVMRKL